MSPKVIAFSGACHSGKTSTIESLSKALTLKGYSVIVLNETIRNYINTSITELRKNPVEYLRIQNKVINEKIENELEVSAMRNCGSDDIYLIDRTICDSLFYLTFYVDKANLTHQQFCSLTNLCNDIHKHAELAYDFIYDNVVMFSPIVENYTQCKFRPDNQLLVSQFEYTTIRAYNEYFLRKCGKLNKLIRVDTQINAVETILNLLDI